MENYWEEKMGNLEKCIWKEMSEDKNSTTFQDVTETHELYRCYGCSGGRGECHNYIHIEKNRSIRVVTNYEVTHSAMIPEEIGTDSIKVGNKYKGKKVTFTKLE